MSNTVFAAILTCAAAVLALWVDTRFPTLAPKGLQRVIVHAAVAFALLHLIPSSGDSILFGFVVLFAVALPLLLYAFLVGVWAIRLLQGAATSLR